MSWDATIFGTLHVPPADYAAWLKRALDSDQVPQAEKYLSTLEVKGSTVEKELNKLSKFEDPDGLGFLDVTCDAKTGIVALRSFFAKDEYLDVCVTLASIWAAAGKTSKGELYFAGMLTASFCQKLTVDKTGVSFEPQKNDAADEMAAYQEIQARVEKRIVDLGL